MLGLVVEIRHLGFCALAVWLLVSCHPGQVRSGNVHSGEWAPSADELFEVAIYQASRGDLLRAEQYLTAALDQGYDETLAAYWLVKVCVAAGRYHSALRHATAYLRESPSDWGMRLVVASIREALGDLSQAQVDLERIVETRPDHALSRYRLAMLYQRGSRTPHRAIPHLRAYLQLAPDGPHAREVRELVDAAEEVSER